MNMIEECDRRKQTSPLICTRCGNKAPMQIKAKHTIYTGSWGRSESTAWGILECPACEKILVRGTKYIGQTEHAYKILYPSSHYIEPPHPDMPEEILSEYNEARSVFEYSPRASAALLRLLVEKLLKILGEKDKSINDAIGSLVGKGLPTEIQQALDCCRVIGNEAVHPGTIDFNDTPESVQTLFSTVNFIINDRIAEPKRRSDLYNQLPKNKLEGIAGRDKTKPK